MISELVRLVTQKHFTSDINRATLRTLKMSGNSYKEWLRTSIQNGSINCCSENDIKLDLKHIGLGGYGVVYKATVRAGSSFEITTRTMLGEWHNRFSGMPVAVKVLHSDKHGGC